MKCETASLQNLVELQKFIAILKAENVRSYLEIGSKFGGSLWRIANALPTGSRIVAVDLPHGDQSFKVSLPPLQECISALVQKGYDARLIVGDSTDPAIIEEVRKLAPFDACFVDANHTVPYVRKDWANYGPMCRLMAFHDIGWIARPQPGKKPIEVPVVWNEIKRNYRHEEIKLDPRDNGIGVLWRV
jgi:cephalosporin hydroxylase